MISAPRAILALAGLAVVAFLAPHLDFVPMWDGWAYAECAVDVAANRFSLYFLRCYGHPAYAYSGLLGVSQLLDPGNPALLLLVNALLFALGAFAFHRLMRHAFPASGYDTDVALITAAFLLQPAFLGLIVQPSLDLPVLVGTVWCLMLLIERRWIWCALVGTAVAFSKETGLLLYGVVLACFGLWVFASTRGGIAPRMRALLSLAPTILPFVAYGGYVAAFLIFRPGESPIWSGTGGKDLPEIAQGVAEGIDSGVASYLALLFVLNFAWVPVVWIITAAVTGVVRRARRLRLPPIEGTNPDVILVLTLAAAATLFALTRIITYSNVRYLLAGTALLLGVAFAALMRLRLGTVARRTVLTAYVALLAVSVVRTVDPVSRMVWGTFPFGSHEMLAMTSITGECCGSGRDQLTYSLEFTRLHDLTDSVVTTLVRDSATVVVVPDWMGYNVIRRTDRATRRQTLRRDGTFEPRVMTGPVVLIRRPPPRSLVYVAMPNAKDTTSLAELAGFYDVGPERRFRSGGYTLSAYELNLKSNSNGAP